MLTLCWCDSQCDVNSILERKQTEIREKQLPCDEPGKSTYNITFVAGEMVEGILRINSKNYEDGYICAADNGQDILIQVGGFVELLLLYVFVFCHMCSG